MSSADLIALLDLFEASEITVWLDGGWYEECERNWRDGQFYKIRGTYGEHERYGPQFDLQVLREVTDADRAEGFDPADFSGPNPGARSASPRLRLVYVGTLWNLTSVAPLVEADFSRPSASRSFSAIRARP